MTPAEIAREALREWRGGERLWDSDLDRLVQAACELSAEEERARIVRWLSWPGHISLDRLLADRIARCEHHEDYWTEEPG